MNAFAIEPLSNRAEVVRGVTFSKRDAIDEPLEGYMPVLRAGNIQSSLLLDENLVFVPEEKVSERQIIRSGDIVMCTSSGSASIVGKTAYAHDNWAGSFGAFCAVVRSRAADCDPRYLFHYLQSPEFRHWTQNSSGANIKNIRKTELDALEIPFPPLKEQCQIAAILDKADAIRRKREQALALADDLLKSTFLEMFGDPASNPFGLVQEPLANCAQFTSGATPSKANQEFWSGDFPWVSPKDMKVDTIFDAQDHISETVFDLTNLKKIPARTPLIVVRGMILAHTVPLAMTGREVSINQDMKAITFEDGIDPIFGFWCLKVQHNEILSRVSTAAHGTKRLDTENLGAISILRPGENAQKAFVSIVNKFDTTRSGMVSALEQANECFASLSQRAFRGEL